MAKLKKEELLEMYRKMEDIRNFDNKVNQLVRRGEVPGMTHFSVGEEAANVGAIAGLEKGDLITSNHRGHGQSIAMGIDLNGMMAEIMVRQTVSVRVRAARCTSLMSMLVTSAPMGSSVAVWVSLSVQPSLRR